MTFDEAAEAFGASCRAASEWKHSYAGAAHRTRIDAAFAHVREAYEAACDADDQERGKPRELIPTNEERLRAEVLRSYRDRMAELERERDGLARTLQSLFDFVWERVRECQDIDGDSVQDKLKELGLIKLEPVRPGDEEYASEWDATELFYPVPITGRPAAGD